MISPSFAPVVGTHPLVAALQHHVVEVDWGLPHRGDVDDPRGHGVAQER
jgi:hypothetical protein